MSSDNQRNTPEDPAISQLKETYQAYWVNEKGEEIPITEEMMAESMSKIKLKSIGTHTGYSKAITPDMLKEAEKV